MSQNDQDLGVCNGESTISATSNATKQVIKVAEQIGSDDTIVNDKHHPAGLGKRKQQDSEPDSYWSATSNSTISSHHIRSLDSVASKRVTGEADLRHIPKKQRTSRNEGCVVDRVKINGRHSSQSPKAKSIYGTKTILKSERGSRNDLVKTKIPTGISGPVKAQIHLIQEFAAAKLDTVLERDPVNHCIITVPESALLGTLMSMRLRYGIGRLHDAAIADVNNAIVERFVRPLGPRLAVDSVTIDTSKPTKFVDNVQKNIVRGSLNGIDILGSHLELNKHHLLKQCKLMECWKADAKPLFDPERFKQTFQRMWRDVEGTSGKRKSRCRPYYRTRDPCR